MKKVFSNFVENSRKPHPLCPGVQMGEPWGYFELKKNKTTYKVVVSDGFEWDHVSVTIKGKNRCPTWLEMDWIKQQFFEEEETVVQFHPAKSEHISDHDYCLHLWRYQGTMPIPPSILVGPGVGDPDRKSH